MNDSEADACGQFGVGRTSVGHGGSVRVGLVKTGKPVQHSIGGTLIAH